VRAGVSTAALAAGLALLVSTAGASRTDNPVLTGDVGASDSYSIHLSDPSGKTITHVDAGTYTLVIHDHSSFHNFHLSGPGVDVATDIEGTGDKTFTIALTDGTYFFQCDAHVGQMHGSFTVGSASTPPPPAPAPKPAPAKLAASIGPGASFSLRPSAGLSAGTFAVAVADRSATDGFRLAGPGLVKQTGTAFRGSVTWHVTLAAGRYSFGSSTRPKLRRTFTVGP